MEIHVQDVCNVIKQVCGSAVEPDTAVLSSGIVDSLGVAELADALNDTFGTSVGVELLTFDVADTPVQITQLLASQ